MKAIPYFFNKTIKVGLFSSLLLVLPISSISQTWQSSIVNFGSNGKLQYFSDTAQNRVIDFSYAGYKNSNVPIPKITKIIATLSPTIGDRTADINNAIQQAASTIPDSTGFRGVIKLDAGKYEIKGTIILNVSGIVLRGSGSDTIGTVFVATGDTPHQRTVLLAGGGVNAAWVKSGSKTNITNAFVQVGSMSFDVVSTAGFNVGDAIIVYHPSSKKWITAVDSGGVAGSTPWTNGTIDILMNKTITAINGNTITIESPITNHLNQSLAQSYIYKIDKSTTKSLIGVEDLRIDIQNWTNETLDENHAWQGVEMYDIEDSWAKNVVALHFGQSGLKCGTASRLTFDSCQALVPVAILTGSQRDNFQVDHYSSNILFTKCYATKARHAFEVSGTSDATTTVFHRCRSLDATNPSEGHYHWPTGILYDCLRDSGNQTDVVLGVYNRGSYGTNHGWAAAHSVVWNCNLKRATTPYGVVICQKPPTAQNFVIGGFGRVNVTGTIPFPQYPLGYVEGFNTTSAKLIPESLFEQQLKDRLNILPINLSSFITQKNNRTVLLKWTSNNEINFDGFEIEYSANAKDFIKIGYIRSQQLSTQHSYSFIHTEPKQGANYYRLKMLDKDGQSSYSKIELVELGKTGFMLKSNVVKDFIEVYAPQKTNTSIVNIDGKILKQFVVNQTQKIDISNLTSGIYFIKTDTGEIEKFIKN